MSPQYQRDKYLNKDTAFFIFRARRDDSETEPENIYISPEVAQMYSIMRKKFGTLSGYSDYIHGELTIGAMQHVINFLKEHCEFNKSSRFIDIGSGLGKPTIHVTLDPGVRLSVGIEVQKDRYEMSIQNGCAILATLKDSAAESLNFAFVNEDVNNAYTLDPFTHVYSFDVGMPPETLKAIAWQFNNSYSAKYLACYHPPSLVIHQYGFKVLYIGQSGGRRMEGKKLLIFC